MQRLIKFFAVMLIFGALFGVLIVSTANAVAKVTQPKAPELLALKASFTEAQTVKALAEAEKLQAEAEQTHAQAQNVAAMGGVITTLLYILVPLGIICALWVIHKILSVL